MLGHWVCGGSHKRSSIHCPSSQCWAHLHVHSCVVCRANQAIGRHVYKHSTCILNIYMYAPSQAVDVLKERIYLDASESTMSADDLPTVVPDGFPRYHFFLFKHTFEGDYQESVGKELHSLIVYVSSVLRVSAYIGCMCTF